MKKMILKIALATLVIGSVPMHAGLGQLVQNGARTVLQGAGNNAGRVAVAMGVLGTALAVYLGRAQYATHAKEVNRQINENQGDQAYQNKLKFVQKNAFWLIPTATAALSAIVAGSAYALAKACGWAGSRI
jgi:hypothetical protein